MLPGILTHLGPEGVHQLKKIAMANALGAHRGGDDEIPDLVQNFESQLSGLSEVNVDDAAQASNSGPTEIVD